LLSLLSALWLEGANLDSSIWHLSFSVVQMSALGSGSASRVLTLAFILLVVAFSAVWSRLKIVILLSVVQLAVDLGSEKDALSCDRLRACGKEEWQHRETFGRPPWTG
jgi:hypothetical protein